MKQWYANDLSKLTQVTVRTLHHYDKIDLLKPGLRLSNGYRVYSEKDLLKLQQIIALKFFGFELSQIKLLLAKHDDVLENLALQSRYLQEKAKSLLEASSILMRITDDCSDKKSIPWEQIIQSIEVYHMTQQVDQAWVKEIFNTEELQQYAAFDAELKSRGPENKATFKQHWADLVDEIKNNLHHDPKSEIGINLAKKCMELINRLYGKKYANLRTKAFEQGFGEGKGLDENGLTPETVTWLTQATDTYWHQRIYAMLDQVGKIPASESLMLWNEVMDDMYGNDAQRKADIFPVALQDNKVSQEAKAWLKKTFHL